MTVNLIWSDLTALFDSVSLGSVHVVWDVLNEAEWTHAPVAAWRSSIPIQSATAFCARCVYEWCATKREGKGERHGRACAIRPVCEHARGRRDENKKQGHSTHHVVGHPQTHGARPRRRIERSAAARREHGEVPHFGSSGRRGGLVAALRRGCGRHRRAALKGRRSRARAARRAVRGGERLLQLPHQHRANGDDSDQRGEQQRAARLRLERRCGAVEHDARRRPRFGAGR